MQTGAIGVSEDQVCTPKEDATAQEETLEQPQDTCMNLDNETDPLSTIPGPEIFDTELKNPTREPKSIKKKRARDCEPDTFRKSNDRKMYRKLPEAVKVMLDSLDAEGVPAVPHEGEESQSRRGESLPHFDQKPETGSEPRRDEPAPGPELAQVQVDKDKVPHKVTKGKVALDYGTLDVNSPEVKSWSCNIATVGELQIGPAFSVHTDMLEIETVPRLEAEVHRVSAEEGQSLILRQSHDGPNHDDPNNPDENEGFPPDGSIMIPDDVTSTVFRAQYLPMVAGQRPYIEVDFFGIHKS